MDEDEHRQRFLKPVTAGYAATPYRYPASETIGIGCIGTGAGAQVLMKNLYTETNRELLAHWIESVRGRRQPKAPVEAGVRAVAPAHLANRALHKGQVAKCEDAAV